MTPWTSAFLDVQYCARQFMLAWEEAQTYRRYPTLGNIRQTLALAKARLECALAYYKVQERIGRVA